MEESIKKAEELIEKTNATLVRMQYDTVHDDINFGLSRTEQFEYVKKGKNLDFNDIQRIISPRERIVETDEAINLNKRNYSIRDDKIDEINYKIDAYRNELLERESMKSFNFKQNTSIPTTRTISDTNLSQKISNRIKSTNLSEDLKLKLQQTQEIVSRGIQTARELNETVEILKSHRQSKIDRYDELSLYKSDKSGRSEDKSTIKTIEGKRCKRCNAEIIRKPIKGKDRKKEDNVLLMNIKGIDSSSSRRKHILNFQQLPTLRIHGGLTCQRIPNVDIPPGKQENLPHRVNTVYETYSHEEIIRDRIDQIIEDIKNSGGFIQSDNGKKTKSVECSNCGKILKVTGKIVQTEQIDELLKICDYNVFDPRIDEFVGRFSGEFEEEAKYTQTEIESSLNPIEVIPEVKRKERINDLSRELMRKYREKATELEIDHLEFEGILRELFEKIDESRALFKNCDYLNTITETGKRKSLSVTPPVLLSYTGSGEEADDGRNAVLRPNRSQKTKIPTKLLRKKLGRKELEINCKLISSASPMKDKWKEMIPKPITPKPVSEVETSLINRKLQKNELIDPKSVKYKHDEPNITKPLEIIIEKSKPGPSSEPIHINPNGEELMKQMNTVSDYESDFEEESLEEKLSEQKTDSYKHNTRLSTICEVESELDGKISNLTIASDLKKDKIEEIKSMDEKVISPKQLSISSDEDDTRKLLKKVNQELKEVASQQLISTKKKEIMNKSSEMSDPLKEVLNALKNQFERTELLADRLSESIKEVNEVKKVEEGEEIGLSNEHGQLLMVNNLQRARKNSEIGKIFTSRSDSLRTLHGKSKKSFHENKSAEEEIRSLSSSESVNSKGTLSAGKSYSEGEISEQEVVISDRSSPSIGEVISENHSEELLSEEKSVIKFL